MSTTNSPSNDTLTVPSEAEILIGMVQPEDGNMPPEAAKALLRLQFDAAATKAIERLLRANAAGAITVEERLLLDRYLRVGQLIDLVQAKARLSLANATT